MKQRMEMSQAMQNFVIIIAIGTIIAMIPWLYLQHTGQTQAENLCQQFGENTTASYNNYLSETIYCYTHTGTGRERFDKNEKGEWIQTY